MHSGVAIAARGLLKSSSRARILRANLAGTMRATTRKILQIMPAPADYYAIFKEKDGTNTRSPVTVFALWQEDEGTSSRRVVGPLCIGDGELVPCADVENFEGLEGPDAPHGCK